MHKIGIIFKREYFTRVRNKTFILSTFLVPAMIILFLVAIIYFSVNSVERQRIAVSDASGIFVNNLKTDSSRVSFEYRSDINAENFSIQGFAAVLLIPPLDRKKKDTIRLISEKQLGFTAQDYVNGQLSAAVQKKLFDENKFDKRLVDSILESSVSTIYAFSALQQRKGKVEESNFWLAYFIGFSGGLLIYIMILIYGNMVMRGVMEEKMNRVAEIMISSVRPFEMMLGKILGIAAVAITQFLLWITLILLLVFGLSALFPHETLQQASDISSKVAAINHLLASANWPLISFCYIFYFTAGYLFYAALFAAVGSAVNDDAQESASLSMPVMLPIMFSFVMMTILIYFPASTLSQWVSIIPFSSPIMMMSRIPFGVPGTVPWWQLGLSMLLLVLGFLATTWVAAKIYRTGMLMYGKKSNLKEMWKWAFRP